MNTILFVSGLGVGAIITSAVTLFALMRGAVKAHASARELNEAHHQEAMAIFRERNELLSLQNSLWERKVVRADFTNPAA